MSPEVIVIPPAPDEQWRKYTLPGGVSLKDLRALPVTDEEPFLLTRRIDRSKR